jgi:integrase
MQTEGTLAWFIQRQFDLRKRMSNSSRWQRQRLQMHPIGAKLVTEIKKTDLEEYARDLLEGKYSENGKPLKPQTVKHYLVHIAAVVQYFVDREELPPEAGVIYRPLLKRLKREKVIGDSQPRRRRPKPIENAWLCQFFADRERQHGVEYGKKSRVIPMTIMQTFQLASSYRISQSCSLMWPDWDRENRTILVRRVKGQLHPKVAALTEHAQKILEALWEIRDPNEPRIFPYRSASVSAAYTSAKKELTEMGFPIVDLRLHDSRRDKGTRLVEEDGFTADEAILFTTHANTSEFRRTYLTLDPAKVATQGPAAKRQHQPAA